MQDPMLEEAGVLDARARVVSHRKKGKRVMSMIWRDPSDAFLPLRQAMDRLMEGSFVWPGSFEIFKGETFPINVYESPDKHQYVVEATVAGFKPEEIQITAEGGQFSI